MDFDDEALLELARQVLVGALARGAAHDIVGPSAYVLTNLEFVREELPPAGVPGDEELLGEVRDCLQESADGVRSMVDQTRLLGRASYPWDPESSRTTELRGVVDEACALVGMWKAHHALFQVDGEPRMLVPGRASDHLLLLGHLLLEALLGLDPEREPRRIRVVVGPILELHWSPQGEQSQAPAVRIGRKARPLLLRRLDAQLDWTAGLVRLRYADPALSGS